MPQSKPIPAASRPDLFAEQDVPGTLGSITDFKNAIKQFHQRLVESFSPDEDIRFLVSQRSDYTDRILQQLWQRFDLNSIDASLVAVGGYGRGELHPCSDIDLLILLNKTEDSKSKAMLEALLTFFWDIGLEVGHSVRTLKECVTEAKADITVATNLMESRLICGNLALFEKMQKKTGPKSIWPGKAFFKAKLEEQIERHRKYNDTAYNLEPNIKGNPGGLRDIQMIGWVAKRHFLAESMHELVKHGFLTEEEYLQLRKGEEHLWRIRFALHILANRREDRLLFDYQRKLSSMFGYMETRNNEAIESFMQAYYRTVIELNRLNEMLLQLFQEALLYKGFAILPKNYGRCFRSYKGYLEVTNEEAFVKSPVALLEIFSILANNPELKGVRASTIRLIREHRYLIDDDFRNNPDAKEIFLGLFKSKTGLTHTLRRMNRYGILAAYLPIFDNIVGRMQYDLFHVYTVDEHTLVAVRNLRRFAIPEHRDEFPLCSDILSSLSMPWVVYLAAFFHDIAKGRNGDHSELGAEDAIEFCRQHGMSAYETSNISWLVRNHLLMSMTAQRKDIEDPQEVYTFASTVADLTRLDYLYLLTVADARATSPMRWNDYKDSLLRQLYLSARKALIRGLDNPIEQSEVIQLKKEYAINGLQALGFDNDQISRLWTTLDSDYFLYSNPDEIIWQSHKVLGGDRQHKPVIEIRKETGRGGTEIFICTDDRENIFSIMTILLAQQGLKILSARIYSAANGCTMNSYIVHEQDGSYIESDQRRQEIIKTLFKGLSNPDSVSDEISTHVHRQIKNFAIEPSVSLNLDENCQQTRMLLRASDMPGLLADVSRVFIDNGIKIHSAKIATIGAEAEDIFMISDQNNAPLSKSHGERLAKSIRQALSD
jgi:[protein-PII] uridylyltransferase